MNPTSFLGGIGWLAIASFFCSGVTDHAIQYLLAPELYSFSSAFLLANFSFVFFSLACASGSPEALVISSLHQQYKNLRNFGYLLLLVFFFNIKSLHHFIIFLRNWNSGFNSGSQVYTFSHETLQFRKKNSVKNYIHRSLVLDQKLSDKGILRFYCLSHACHSKNVSFQVLIIKRLISSNSKTIDAKQARGSLQSSRSYSVTILPILDFPR